jgi:hypothetical protein
MTDIEIPIGKRTKKYRFFEMLPALLSIGLILLPIVLSLVSPLLATIFIIGYLIMWFVKAIASAYRTVQGYGSLESAQKTNWQQRLADLEDPEGSLLRVAPLLTARKREWHITHHYRALSRVAESPKAYFKPSEAYNAVIIAMYNESREILEPTLQALFASSYDMKHVILIIAYEARGPQASRDLAHDIIKKYGDKCFYAAAVEHPDGIKNEVRGKGGNITYAGVFLQDFLKQKGIDDEKVLVTTLDADNRPHHSYLAYAMYEYICDPERDHRAYQPIALYINNIWDVPAPMRVLATGNSFWTIINAMRPHMLRNFASHSQGMASLRHTKLWSARTIVEDGHQYWRSWFAFDGQYEVTPIYVPIYQDAVLADSYFKTIKAQFLQLRRWAYGASDIAYVGDKGFRKNRTVPFWSFFGRFLRLVDSHVSWAVAPVIITFGAWAPLFINQDSQHSIVAHELPQVASQLQFLAMFGLFVTVFLTFKMLPPRPERYKRRRNIFMLAQWLFMPITSIGFGTTASLNSQFRLLFGKYLDKFDVTVKSVRKDKN